MKIKEDPQIGGEWREQVTDARATVPAGGFKCTGTTSAANLSDLALDSGFSQCRALLGLGVLTLQRAGAAAQCEVWLPGMHERFDPPHDINWHGAIRL